MNWQVTIKLLSAVWLVTLTAMSAQGAEPAKGKLLYNRDIRPILFENCFACHGPDSAARKGDLRLDQRAGAVEHGAIVPGKASASEALKRILSKDADEVMPPPSSHKKLSAADIETLRRWIDAGAEYQPHWSLIAPVRPTPPQVKNEKWVRNPIDRFILVELEEQQLAPAEEADRRTIARRLSLDLTGLPPAPVDVERFVHDTSPQAYERLVDQFLDSPQWGEHRARYWLDAARYADTHGIHFDNFREMWSYRDWVISAFNRNLPFDQFTIEQLAGDLLPQRTLEQQIASGFNRCNITTNEGGAIAEEYQVLYNRDRTETFAQVWLGATAGCAVCHDHKFDPLSQKEFYELAAFFNNTTQGAMDGNIKDTPPVIVVPAEEDRAKFDALTKQTEKLKAEQAARANQARAEFAKFMATASIGDVINRLPINGLQLYAPLSDGRAEIAYVAQGEERSTTLKGELTWDQGRIGPASFKSGSKVHAKLPEAGTFSAKEPFACAVWVKLPATARNGTLLCQVDEKQRGWELRLENARISLYVLDPGTALRLQPRSGAPLNQWVHVAWSYDGSGKAAGVRLFINGQSQDLNSLNDALKSDFTATGNLHIGEKADGKGVLEDGQFEDLRLYSRALTEQDATLLATTSPAVSIVAKAPAARSPAEMDELYRWWLRALDEPYARMANELGQTNEALANLRFRGTVAHVMQEKPEQAMAYVLSRGDYDKRRDAVKPSTPKALPTMPADLARNRLGLAQWLLRPEQPLTSRVTVNRFWQEMFGTGLVRSSGDFGIAGELPSHPELLDWLAVEFRESGWNVKQLFKLIVTSATYRQAAVSTPAKLEKDPHNRLLSRGPRFRMDAEMVRDYSLAASGLLVKTIGGPSVKPYQPEGVWEAVAMIGSNTRDYKHDTGPNLYRRSMYTLWKRSAPPASMDIFNAPSRETCVVRRERTNTPLQALVTLNDPQYVEAARHLAQVALLDSGNDDLRIDWIGRRLLARPFRSDELSIVRRSLKELRNYYAAHETDARALIAVGESKADARLKPGELAAWTMLVNELMNLDEVLAK